jgi:hypothetical protein
MKLRKPRRTRSLNEALEFAERNEPPLVRRGLPVDILGVWCLAKEMARSKRIHSPLDVAVLTPILPESSPSHPRALDASIKALKKTVRASDVVAWHREHSILAILPDTSSEEAHTAIARWRSEMWHRSLRAGGLLWTSVIVENAAAFSDPKAVLREAERLAATPPALTA